MQRITHYKNIEEARKSITPEMWAKWCAHKSNKERWIEEQEQYEN